MIGFILRRVLQAAIVVFFVVLFVFGLAQLIPGGQCKAANGAKATLEFCKHWNHLEGLDQPLWVQLWHYLLGLFKLNLGFSFKRTQPVFDVIREFLPRTIVLVGTSTVLALMVAIPLGIYQVVRRNKADDYLLTGLSFMFYAMPPFLLGTILIIIFNFDLHLLPVSPPSDASPWAVFTDPRAFIMPVITLAAITIASFSRYMRSSMMETMAEDYIRTARAKGSSQQRVLYGHALRNAIIPIITLVGLSFPAIVSGAVITEDVFNYPGMGYLTVQAALADDVPLVLGCTLVATVAAIIGSLVADIAYAMTDPRIRFGGG